MIQNNQIEKKFKQIFPGRIVAGTEYITKKFCLLFDTSNIYGCNTFLAKLDFQPIVSLS